MTGDNVYSFPSHPKPLCKACLKINHSKYAQTDKGKAAIKSGSLRRRGWTEELHDQIYANQKGLCGICKKPLDKPYHDHDHDTETPRGLLCFTCNSGLGMFQDSLEIVEAAANYLKEYAAEGK